MTRRTRRRRNLRPPRAMSPRQVRAHLWRWRINRIIWAAGSALEFISRITRKLDPPITRERDHQP